MLLFLFAFCRNASLNNFTPCLNIFEPDSTYPTGQGGGIFIFLRFSKMDVLLLIGYIFMSSIPKNQKIYHFCMAKFSLSKNHFRPPKWAKRFLTWSKEFLNKLRNKFFFRCNLHKCKIKKYFFCLFQGYWQNCLRHSEDQHQVKKQQIKANFWIWGPRTVQFNMTCVQKVV